MAWDQANDGPFNGLKKDKGAGQTVPLDSLVSCPFCGSKAKLWEKENRLEVHCDGFGCYTVQKCLSHSKQDAIDKWNSRTANDMNSGE